MRCCRYCGSSELQPHEFSCPADPVTNEHLVEKFGPMAVIKNPFAEQVPIKIHSNIVQRPWGTFEILAENADSPPYWKLKEIIVNPNEALSLQKHSNRDEVWKITEGHGYIQESKDKTNWQVIGSAPAISVVSIPAEQLHRLIAGPEGIKLLELATSLTHPIDENDITRYEDKYGRV